MLLKNRVAKLEKGTPHDDGLPKIAFVSFISSGDESGDTSHATIIGKGPALNREHEESEAEFIQRAYVEYVKAHGLDKVDPSTLNDSDLAMIVAATSPELALKHLKGDGLTEDDLSAVAEKRSRRIGCE